MAVCMYDKRHMMRVFTSVAFAITSVMSPAGIGGESLFSVKSGKYGTPKQQQPEKPFPVGMGGIRHVGFSMVDGEFALFPPVNGKTSR